MPCCGLFHSSPGRQDFVARRARYDRRDADRRSPSQRIVRCKPRLRYGVPKACGWLLTLVTALSTLPIGTTRAEAVPVELQRTPQGWELLRDGKPYFIRGAGGQGSLRELAAAGANSVRTWGADDIGPLLDEAHALGLTVTVGIWLGHERHGFDYSDQAQLQQQMDHARDAVLRYKDHPAVLLWGIGNEMEGFESGDDPAIWSVVNDIAEMVKTLDPAHPTMMAPSAKPGAFRYHRPSSGSSARAVETSPAAFSIEVEANSDQWARLRRSNNALQVC